MGVYMVTDPATGRKVKLTGDVPPTEQELEEVFASISAPKADFSGVEGGTQTSVTEPSFRDQIEAAARGHLAGDTQAGVRQGLKQAGLGLGQLAVQGGATGLAMRKVGDMLGLPDAPIDPMTMASDYLGNV